MRHLALSCATRRRLDQLEEVSDADDLLAEHDIDATNVRPAFEASLQHGATEEEIKREVGWRRADLIAAGATVSGESTHLHMELMARKPDYSRFVLAAVQRHTASSLGVVGLACRTCPTLAEAFACHGRFQRLTNRTAEYAVSVDAEGVTITETRFGEPSLGSLLISDYTMLVALHLLRSVAAEPPEVRAMHSRRRSIAQSEIAAYEEFIGAPIVLGAERARLVLSPASLMSPVATADAELAAYFQGVLHQAAGLEPGEPQLLDDVRRTIRDQLHQGAPSAAEVARALGLGHRTLQRRLSDLGHSFADLLENTRRTLAERLLTDPELSLGEVAYLLGYTEKASFYRAFRRWHDTTPAAYRANHAP